jgi:hypothetical protein
MYNNNNQNMNNILQDARAKLDAEFQQRQYQINSEYQEKMQKIINDVQNFGRQYQSPQNPHNPTHQQLTPVNSEIQNAFMRSPEYQENFQSAFNQCLMQNFFYQFQGSQFYAELKKYADNAYPEFEKKYIAAVNKIHTEEEDKQKNNKKGDKNEGN